MLEILAIIILSIWVLGIVVFALLIPYALKQDDFDAEMKEHVNRAWEISPSATVTMLSLVIVFWPASLAYGAWMEGKK